MSMRRTRIREWWKVHSERVIVTSVILAIWLVALWWILRGLQCLQAPGSC